MQYDVQIIAKSFGGGGHLHAAGFKLPREGSFDDQVKAVSQKIAKDISN